MKTVIIQCFRKPPDIPFWIGRCMASVKAWAAAKNYEYWFADDSAFALCGEDYLRKVGDNKRSITNLCRLELIKRAHAEGYDRAVWIDADVFVFDPAALDFPPARRIMFPRETWMVHSEKGWLVKEAVNNCVVVCPAGDPDLDFIIRAIRYTVAQHDIENNFQVGIELIKGLNMFLKFDLLPNIGMFSNYILMAIAQNDEPPLNHQARWHRTPVHAANLSASEHVLPVVPADVTLRVMDILEKTRGGIINDRLLPGTAPASPQE